MLARQGREPGRAGPVGLSVSILLHLCIQVEGSCDASRQPSFCIFDVSFDHEGVGSGEKRSDKWVWENMGRGRQATARPSRVGLFLVERDYLVFFVLPHLTYEELLLYIYTPRGSAQPGPWTVWQCWCLALQGRDGIPIVFDEMS